MSTKLLRKIVPLVLFLMSGGSVWGAGYAPFQNAPKQLTVERLYNQPSLSGKYLRGVVWFPDGSGFTYLRRNPETKIVDLWKYSIASQKRSCFVNGSWFREKIKALLGDSTKSAPALSLSRYQWMPDKKHLLFIERSFFVLFNSQHKSIRIIPFKRPASNFRVSPDGSKIAFVRNYDLFVLDLSDGKETRLTFNGSEEVRNATLDWVYPEELDIYHGFWWAPDSRHIAYLQMDERPVKKFPIIDFIPLYEKITYERYPKAGEANPIVRVGVVTVKKPRTRWMNVGENTDVYIPRVKWLPDAKTLAIQRMSRSQKKLDVLFTSISTGQSHVILHEEDPYWINIKNDWYFLKRKSEFIWGSERDGFRHLYLYNDSGRLIRQITKGEWEVESLVGVDEQHGKVFFMSTEKDVRERHFYSIKLNGRKMKRLTPFDGTHRVTVSPKFRYFLDTYSTSAFPAKTALFSTKGKILDWINKNNVPELANYHLQPPKLVTIQADDGATLYGSLIRPPDFDPKQKYPVLIYVYGGPHAQVVRNAWGGTTYLWHQLMAQKGYLIFSLDNRGSWGRGHSWETAIYHHFGRKELADQLAGVAYLKSLPYVDSTRIGIWGWSYGGYMTLYSLLNAPKTFKAGFAVAPVTDWRFYDTIYTERYMGTPKENPDGYRESSPVNQAGNLESKLFIAHGTSDDNVHFQNTVHMIEKFIENNKQMNVFFYPRKTHGIGGRADRIHLFTQITNFFLKNL